MFEGIRKLIVILVLFLSWTTSTVFEFAQQSHASHSSVTSEFFDSDEQATLESSAEEDLAQVEDDFLNQPFQFLKPISFLKFPYISLFHIPDQSRLNNIHRPPEA